MDLKAHQAGTVGQNHFWFRSRVELVEILLEKAKIPAKAKILNVGCGVGDDLEIISKFGRVSVLDIDKATLDLVPKHLVKEKCLADVCQIPYPDNSFDIAIAFDILEHIKDDEKAVSELRRVLKPNGKIVFSVPAFNGLYSAHDVMEKHMRRYNKGMAKKLFKDFKQETLGYWLFGLFAPAAVQRILTKKTSSSDYFQKSMPSLVHSLFYRITHLENWCIKKGLKFPWGLTLYGIYKK